MGPVETGIYGRFDASTDLKTALTGGLHVETAPQGTSKPFGTFTILPSSPRYMFGETYEYVNVQFDIYTTTRASRATLYGYLTALYDDCHPTVTGYSAIIMERTMQHMTRSGDNDEFFRAIVEYQLRLKKS